MSTSRGPDRIAGQLNIGSGYHGAFTLVHFGRATLADGTRVSAETLRRVACDGGLVVVVSDVSGNVLDVGRRTRAIPAAIRRALLVRDRHCRFPGCANGSFLHGHHVQHWMHGGRTSLDNLLTICSFHHRQVHEGGFAGSLSEVDFRRATASSGDALRSADLGQSRHARTGQVA